jgi:transposase
MLQSLPAHALHGCNDLHICSHGRARVGAGSRAGTVDRWWLGYTSAARASALISNYRDHTPALSTVANLAHHGVDLSRSTLAGWVGEAC